LAFLYLGVFAISVICSLVLTRWVRGLAVARGWVTAPDTRRHLHPVPLPRLGGVAVFLAFYLTIFFTLAASRIFRGMNVIFSVRDLLPIGVAGFIILLLGIYDDLHGIKPYPKIAVQAAAGLILFAGGLRFHFFAGLFHGQTLPWFFDLPLTLLWVLTITNAFNLIDGVDGLAAGSALFSTVVFFVVALVNHASLAPFLVLALAGSILGFLHYNLNPATIFLGDSGSLFIGFTLSALALQSAEKAPTIVAVAIPVVSFGLPILETLLSIVRRWIGGRPLFEADREHIHHKLLALGLSPREVVIVLYAVSAIFGLLSLFLLRPSGAAIGVVLVILGCGIWIGVQHLGYLEFGELRRIAQRTVDHRKTVINNLAIRHAIQDLRSVRDYDHFVQILVAAFAASDFDGFELQMRSLPKQIVSRQGLRIVPNREGHPCLQWRKPQAASAQLTENSWRLDLNLVGMNGTGPASLTLYRFYCDSALQLYVNLLTSEFPLALADAISRTVHQLRTVPSQRPRKEEVVAEAS